MPPAPAASQPAAPAQPVPASNVTFDLETLTALRYYTRLGCSGDDLTMACRAIPSVLRASMTGGRASVAHYARAVELSNEHASLSEIAGNLWQAAAAAGLPVPSEQRFAEYKRKLDDDERLQRAWEVKMGIVS
jgi:hypothetical protein